MQFPAERNGIRYDRATPESFGPAVELVARTFARDEPLAVAVGQTQAELRAMLSLAAPTALAEQLTVQTWAGTTTMGVALATRFTWLPPDTAVTASPNFAAIGGLLEVLEADYETRSEAERTHCVHVHMLVVDADFRGRHIGRELLRLCLANAAEQGMTSAIADATNPASRRSFEAAGFSAINEVDYESFEFEGARVFAKVTGADHIALMWRTI
jgi:ribosomal protein S18 acetylase RimI-like enzyme